MQHSGGCGGWPTRHRARETSVPDRAPRPLRSPAAHRRSAEFRPQPAQGLSLAARALLAAGTLALPAGPALPSDSAASPWLADPSVDFVVPDVAPAPHTPGVARVRGRTKADARDEIDVLVVYTSAAKHAVSGDMDAHLERLFAASAQAYATAKSPRGSASSTPSRTPTTTTRPTPACMLVCCAVTATLPRRRPPAQRRGTGPTWWCCSMPTSRACAGRLCYLGAPIDQFSLRRRRGRVPPHLHTRSEPPARGRAQPRGTPPGRANPRFPYGHGPASARPAGAPSWPTTPPGAARAKSPTSRTPTSSTRHPDRRPRATEQRACDERARRARGELPGARRRRPAAEMHEHRLPLVPGVDQYPLQGLIRVRNRAGLRRRGRGDRVRRDRQAHGPVSLTLAARHTLGLTSADLERGNDAKGFAGGCGRRPGDLVTAARTTLPLRRALTCVRRAGTSRGARNRAHDLRGHQAIATTGRRCSTRRATSAGAAACASCPATIRAALTQPSPPGTARQVRRGHRACLAARRNLARTQRAGPREPAITKSQWAVSATARASGACA